MTIQEKRNKNHIEGTTLCDKLFARSKEEVYDTVLGKYLPISHPSVQRTLASTDPRHDASSLRGVNQDFTFVKKLKKEKKYTFIMIEHDLDFISKLCDTIIVMAEGQFLTQGNIQQIKSNQKVIDIYLGKS